MGLVKGPVPPRAGPDGRGHLLCVCSFTLELHKHISKDSDFWGKGGDVLPEPDPRSQPLDPEADQIAGPKQDARKQLSKDFSATEMRLVHLDLKGAAPKVSYLEQVSGL